jgi:hypothetical protein
MNLQEQLNRIQEMIVKVTNEQFDDYGDIKKFQNIKRDWRKDVATQEERGIGKIKSSLKGEQIGNIIKDIKKDFDINKLKYVGEGHYGMAFITDDNKILKLTNNDDEVRGISKVVGKEIPGMVNYHNIKTYPNFNLFAILMDRAEPLSKEEETVYTTMYYEGSNYSDSTFWDEYDDEDEDIREDLLERLLDRLENPLPEDKLPVVEIDENTLVNYIERYRELLKILEDNNIPTQDLHGGNIGEINGELVHYDVMDFPEQI